MASGVANSHVAGAARSAVLNHSDAFAAEVANTITHALGLVLSIVASVVLLRAARELSAWQFAACVLYSATMVLVYAMSTLSHVVWQPRLRHLFRVLDQGCIYLFITGTFTPIAVTYLHSTWCWGVLATMWAISLAGLLSKIVWVHRIDAASVIIPVVLGWMPVLDAPAIRAYVPAPVIWWMVAGGFCYTLGTLFLMSDHRHRYLHAIWHLWVIAGSALQYWAILHFIVQAA